MLPKADRDQLYVYYDASIGTGVATTDARASAIAGVLHRDPAVTSIQHFIGQPPILDFNGMFKGAQHRTGAHQATLRVNLRPADARSRASFTVTRDLRAALTAAAPQLAADVRFIEEPPGPPVRATFVGKVRADDAALRASTTAALAASVAELAGTADVETSIPDRAERIRYTIDAAAARAAGISRHAVATALASAQGATEIGEFRAGSGPEYTPLLLSSERTTRATPNDLAGITLRAADGTTVPLAALVTRSYERAPAPAQFADGAPVAYVTSATVARPIVYVIGELTYRLAREGLDGLSLKQWGLTGVTLATPAGETVRVDWDGEFAMTLENFRDLGIAMGVALVAVYLVLVAQYNSFTTPLYILVTVPLGLVGILSGFLILDQAFGILLTATALIGFIALIGIVVNNAIIYLEYVRVARADGATLPVALVAGGSARLRPILLTSLTTVLGSLTIAADPVWSGLAWAIVFGLSLSTVLTLLVYPVLLCFSAGATLTASEREQLLAG